ncbi:MAG: pyruvate kinase [Thermaerobacter sp.]|nr:pyruvate kinase [Thermaerobacter sp.]
MRRTKIVATIGPACETVVGLMGLMQAGMDVARLNLSHGSVDIHRDRIRRIREASSRLGREVGIMLDTRGPEVRIGDVPVPFRLEPGDRLNLVRNSPEPQPAVTAVTVTWPGLFEWIKPQTELLIDDGNLVARCLTANPDRIELEMVVGGVLKSRKKINCPGTLWPLNPLDAADQEAIRMGIEEDVDFLAASFVHSADDVIAVRRFVEENGGSLLLIAKIEDRSAVDRLEDILTVADGVMVARGDLGVEMPAEDVPWLQKEIIQRSNQRGLPVITATQMLESMVTASRPTRAETSDVANAIWDGSDAVMLSAETATGEYPEEAVRVMARVAENADHRPRYLHRIEWNTTRIADAVSRASAEIGENLGARAILSITESGYTAQMVSRSRPMVPIVALSPHQKVVRRLALVWGVTTLLMARPAHPDSLVGEAIETARQAGLVGNEDVVVVTAGFPPGTPGTTNLLRIETVRGPVVTGQGLGNGMVAFGKVVCWTEGEPVDVPVGPYVLVLPYLDPAAVPTLEGAQAVVTEQAGLTSDVAVAALTLGIPAVVGALEACRKLTPGEVVTVDPIRGVVYRGRVSV